MDHLPQVVGAIAPIEKVPCMCDPHSFDGDSFETFPTRKGYRLIVQSKFPRFILNADGSRLTSEQLANIAQAWLFFGLLTSVLQVSSILVDPEDFVRRDGTDIFITTALLPEYLERWNQAEFVLPTETRKKHYRRQQDIIMVATCFRFHQISDQWFHYTPGWSPLFEPPVERYKMTIPLPIELSFCILEETLDRASRRSRGINHHTTSNDRLCKGLIKNLERDGWCQSETSLIRACDDTGIFFASRLKRQRTKADHSKCTASKCLAFNIITEEYKTQHTDACQGCNDVSINKDALASTLRLGKTPRVRVSVEFRDGGPQIRLLVADSGPYVAISHVWSDGLGNAAANSLPSCQLLRLRSLTMELGVEFADDMPAFWIDSLLVPVKKGAEKRMALGRLSHYYREAAKVLVLDSDLLMASQFSSQEEQMSRILLSTWMRRLWTLEEGILSRDRLEFQFQDGVISMKRLAQTTEISLRLDNIGNSFDGDLQMYLPDVADQYQMQANEPQARSQTIQKLLRVLQYRSTTKAADETLCISHILGLDPSALTCIDEADFRMKEFIKMLTEHETTFPRRLLFTNEPKLQMDGTRWSPTSFMAFDNEDVIYVCQSMNYCKYCIDKGLLVDGLKGFILDFGDETFKNVTFIEFDDVVIYALTPTPIGENCQTGDRFWCPKQHTTALNGDTAQEWSQECQELIGKSPGLVAVLYEEFGRALLVSIYSSERLSDEKHDFLLYARPISRVYLRELKVQDQNFFACGADSAVIRFTNPDWDFERTKSQMHAELDKFHNPATSTFLQGIGIVPGQRWCIG